MSIAAKHSERLKYDFSLELPVTVRRCRRADLPQLEWFGLFRDHREIFSRAYGRQELGEVLMLVAESNAFPIGQIWIDFERGRSPRSALLWAFRIFPVVRGRGMGRRILRIAESVLRERSLHYAELGVEKANPGARRLYERMGYRIFDEAFEEYRYTTPEGQQVRCEIDQWLLRKDLTRGVSHSPGREVDRAGRKGTE